MTEREGRPAYDLWEAWRVYSATLARHGVKPPTPDESPEFHNGFIAGYTTLYRHILPADE